MIKRKSLVEEKSEKQKEERKKKIKINLNDLQDAVVDGQLKAKIGDTVFFERSLNGTKRIHMGFIKAADENGLVHVWDDTREQWFIFSLKEELPLIKLA
jgi:hypothetical protein